MNRKLLPSLIALLTVGAAGVVNADIPIPTVYGKVNLTLNKYDFDDIQSGTRVNGQNNWKLESNASRLGVKGDYPLFGDTKAIYKLEYEVYPDADKQGDGTSPFKQRNTYAGLQSGWGTLFAGKNDTPLKATTAETLQLFKDLPLADYKYVLNGENRENNIIQYATPNLSGLIFSAQLILGEDTGASDSTGAKSKDQNSNLTNKYSAAVTYKLDTLYLALAHDRNVENADTTRFAAQYGIGPVSIGGLYQNAERHFKNPATTSVANGVNTGNALQAISSLPGNSLNSGVGNPITDFAGGTYKKQTGYGFDIAWKIDDDWTLKGQYVRSKSDPVDAANVGFGDTTAKNYAVGVDYALSKAAKVFAYYASIKTDGDLSAINSESLDDKTYAVGWEFKF
ncbi:MAG TPA: porin [Spongiibacteraceae bacterium]